MEEALIPKKEALLAEIQRIYGAGQGRGKFVILEGRNLVDACLRHKGCLRALVLVGESHRDLEPEVGEEVELIRVGKAEAKELTGFSFHRGVLGLADRPPSVGLDALVEDAAKGGLLVVCPQLGDPGNLGAIVRCAAAFGATGVVTGSGGPDVFGRKAMRGSAGSVFAVPTAECDDLLGAVLRMKRAGIEVLGTDGGDVRASRVEDYSAPLGRGLALLLGNEGEGLPEDVIAQCDAVLRIDVSPAVESLNAACAAAVLLHAIRGMAPRAPGSCSV